MKILLDPLLYWFKGSYYEKEYFDYLDKVTKIIEKYFNIKYFSTTELINIVQRINKEPFGQYRIDETRKRNIAHRLLVGLDYDNNVNNVNDSLPYSLPTDFISSTNNDLNNHFRCLLRYVLDNRDDNYLILLSLPNHENRINDFDYIFFIRHISGEINSKITDLIKNHEFIKDNLPEPTLSDPLPNADLCDHFYDLQQEMRKHDTDMSVFFRITKEVAFRNNYKYDRIVSNKNDNDDHKREIYTFNKRQFISADFESGCFELHNSRGKHKGEYSYEGKQISPPDESGRHDIKI